MKRTATLLLALIMVCSLLAGCGDKGTTDDSSNNANTDENPTVAITFCNMLATDHPQSIAATEVLAPEISEKTGGKFTIDVQVNGALGSDAEATEATIMGTMNSSCFFRPQLVHSRRALRLQVQGARPRSA